jgi:hypothetical protein
MFSPCFTGAIRLAAGLALMAAGPAEEVAP